MRRKYPNLFRLSTRMNNLFEKHQCLCQYYNKKRKKSSEKVYILIVLKYWRERSIKVLPMTSETISGVCVSYSDLTIINQCRKKRGKEWHLYSTYEKKKQKKKICWFIYQFNATTFLFYAIIIIIWRAICNCRSYSLGKVEMSLVLVLFFSLLKWEKKKKKKDSSSSFSNLISSIWHFFYLFDKIDIYVKFISLLISKLTDDCIIYTILNNVIVICNLTMW